MKFSVIIPAYNAAATIDRTIESVLNQSHRPFEILVLDDGSTDETFELLKRYQSRLTVFRRANGGLSSARNFLCARTAGDIVAMLDADDLWHPRYLELQERMFTVYPHAVGSITRYQPFRAEEEVVWSPFPNDVKFDSQLLEPVDFLRIYSQRGINFLPSFCCLPKKVLEKMGDAPFPDELKGTGDFFVFNALTLQGPVAVFQKPFGAYRLRPDSLSSNHLHVTGEMLQADGLLVQRTGLSRSPFLAPTYFTASASLRRRYGKHLMGVGRLAEARKSLISAMKVPAGWSSLAKSVGLYFATLLPKPIQPHWPASDRDGQVH
jgi:glycosyltransferase involved in cell wall biosynthesis